MFHPEMSRALADQHIRDLHRRAASSVRLDAPPSPVASTGPCSPCACTCAAPAAATPVGVRLRGARPARARRAASRPRRPGRPRRDSRWAASRDRTTRRRRVARRASTPSSWTVPTRPPWRASTPRCWAGRSTRTATSRWQSLAGDGSGWPLAFQRAERYVAAVLARRRTTAAAPRPDRDGHGGRARPRRRAGRRPLDPQARPDRRRRAGASGCTPTRPATRSVSVADRADTAAVAGRGAVVRPNGVRCQASVQPGRHQLADSRERRQDQRAPVGSRHVVGQAGAVTATDAHLPPARPASCRAVRRAARRSCCRARRPRAAAPAGRRGTAARPGRRRASAGLGRRQQLPARSSTRTRARSAAQVVLSRPSRTASRSISRRRDRRPHPCPAPGTAGPRRRGRRGPAGRSWRRCRSG